MLVLATLFAFSRFLDTRFLRLWLAGWKLDDYLAGYWVGESESATLILEMLANRIENPNHEGSRVDYLLEACPFADEAECIFAGFDQCAPAEAFETWIYATVLRINCSCWSGLTRNRTILNAVMSFTQR